ncbi:hypothetical protein GGR52DRAFT_555296 [Hypoxylon sp. FL1284]|nr:hypothetical protein GGR52DRAFT_555296 [Hypoxylon sp. FL1284]
MLTCLPSILLLGSKCVVRGANHSAISDIRTLFSPSNHLQSFLFFIYQLLCLCPSSCSPSSLSSSSLSSSSLSFASFSLASVSASSLSALSLSPSYPCSSPKTQKLLTCEGR